MKKSIIPLICAAVFAVAPIVHGADITVLVNGTELESDTPAVIVNERTMLPMRAVFEALDAEVTWMPDDKLIFAVKDTRMIVMQIDNPQMSLQTTDTDGITAIPLDTAPYIENDRTMVPVRAIAEALDAEVNWNGDTQTVTITLG